MGKRLILICCFLTGLLQSIHACQCPITVLGKAECDKYEIIFKGKIKSVKECGNRYGEALFEVEELYKGNIAQQFVVLFECNVACAQKLNAGEEWIIYTRYKQVNNAMMDWCSRSRKFFSNEKEDFYTVTYGNDYYDELKFLRENMGLHRFLKPQQTAQEKRNLLPTNTQSIIIVLCSIGTLILFYWLFNRFFKF
ncbi:MAG: hypothetical protein QM534_04465 [Sediminibacterium sp.]|nr:hypothetical protein [Sediminibacterium sp.]